MGDGRQLFAEMPRGAFYVEDRANRRIIYAGRGIGESYMVLYRNLEGGTGSHRLRIRQTLTNTDGHRQTRTEGILARATLSEAMRDLWQWVRGKQGTGLVVVEGELD